MDWKDTVVKFYDLKKRSLTFKGNLYDYAYISHKRSVGVITEILGENLFTIAFFPSMKNDQTFVGTVNFDRKRDFIIPRYESLLKFANYIIQKEIELEKTIDVIDRKFSDDITSSYKLHEKLAEMYRENTGSGRSEYDMILYFICDWLGLKDQIYR
ncbi:MAG: hypothetical protein GY940_07040 [bacterium]|nr:hypothetical protein [bacterium]